MPVVMRKRPKSHSLRHSQREAATHTVMITILVSVSTFSVLENPKMIGDACLRALPRHAAPSGHYSAESVLSREKTITSVRPVGWERKDRSRPSST